MKRKLLTILGLVGLIGLTLGAVYNRRSETVARVVTDVASRGSIVSSIAASGTLEAVSIVQVGTQVSGTVQTPFRRLQLHGETRSAADASGSLAVPDADRRGAGEPLFTIAADLAQMQVKANIDESDFGAIHEGQAVTFRVDAYPDEVFGGRSAGSSVLNPLSASSDTSYGFSQLSTGPANRLNAAAGGLLPTRGRTPFGDLLLRLGGDKRN
jgi:multidrug efflux pump subunit AcrA (membrane-fusion protein)